MTRPERWTIGLMMFFLSVGLLALAVMFIGQGLIIQQIQTQLEQERQHAQAQLPGANCDTDILCLDQTTGKVTCGPCPATAGTAL